MSFDKDTRNLLARTVTACRRRLMEDVTDQLQGVYGIHPDGSLIPLEKLTHLSPDQIAAAGRLRDLLEHYAAGAPGKDKEKRKASYERMVLEVSFTVLNRLAALRLCEERGLVIECVRQGTASAGFQMFERISGGALGTRYETYRVFLECMFDELALDLGVLFDRTAPQSAVFPSERCLEDVLEELNKPELKHLWNEDETIGWVYQYFNPPEERRAMRDASAAPRNSRELAVRNQFFTPRYVVEFLTDNTLGRIWYEMRQGRTALAEECRYMVRRPNEVFLVPGEEAPAEQDADEDLSQEELLRRPVYVKHRPKKDPREIRVLDPACGSGHFLLYAFDLLERIYEEAWLDPELGPPLWEALGCTPEVDESASEDVVDPNSVRLQADARPVGEGNCRDLSDCYVVITDRYDTPFLAGRPLVYSGNLCEERKDAILCRIPVTEFSYSDAIEQGWFANQTGTIFLDLHKELFAYEMGGPKEGMFERLEWAAQEQNMDQLRATVPQWVMAHNLHGIDIDSRAVQIAALALWLRAQKTWKSLGLKAPKRPQIARSNIVTAEPMPGEADMKDEFAAGLKPRVLGQIVDVVFEKMKLAGEAGSLLKIEEEIKDAVAEARKQWIEGPKMEQGLLFPDIETPQAQQLEMKFDVSGVTDEGFWEQAEDRILDALRGYAEQAENGHAARRRLFAEDAARGFAFIDLCRKHYDAVLMNPPFGEANQSTVALVSQSFSDWNGNLLCAFISRAGLFATGGQIGVVYDRTANIKNTYEDFRKRYFLGTDSFLEAVVDLGWEVLDANVEVSSGVIRNRAADTCTLTWGCDLTKVDKATKQSHLLGSIPPNRNHLAKTVRTLALLNLPNSVIGYYFDDFLIRIFDRFPSLEESRIKVFNGHTIKSDEYFRYWWEPNCSELMGEHPRWARLYNGGSYSRYYSPEMDVVFYGDNGRLIQNHPSTIFRNLGLQQQPGIAFGKRGEFIDAHILRKGFVSTVEGQACSVGSVQHAFTGLALLNSLVFQYGINAYCGQHKYPGYVNLFPIPDVSNPDIRNAAHWCRELVEKKSTCSIYDETAPSFTSALGPSRTLADFIAHLSELSATISVLHEKINEEFFSAFQLSTEDIATIKEYGENEPQDRIWDDEPGVPREDLIVRRVFSYCVGCTFGRWDTRVSIDLSLAPTLPDLFDLLPVCPPGMLVGPDGLPAEANRIVSEEWLRARPDANTLPPEGSVKTLTISDSEYPLRISWDGILVDDAGFTGAHPHRNDIVRRVREVFDLLWKDKAHEIEQEACDILGISDLRDYFRKPSGFFQDHLKRYSKSRRKAPIYWPLSTASGSYTIWIYYHRLTDQTLYTAVNKYVEPKIGEIERGLGRVEDDLKTTSGGEATRLRDRVNETRTHLGELRELREELLRIAALPYKPNLNDGAIINAAPFHTLFRLRTWANDTEACWKKLEKGDYDWAHLAYAIWPDRVREVCKKDRSIAIAHGLEDLCEVEPPKPKKKRASKKKSGG